MVKPKDSGRESGKGKGVSGEGQEPSLLDKLIKEYDLENVYKEAKSQINPKSISYGGSNHNKTLSNCSVS